MENTARLAPFFLAFALIALAAGESTPALGASFTVNATHDAPDATPGDGVCADAGGACTLRAAIYESNALPGADSIGVPAGMYTMTVTVDGAVIGLSIEDALTLNGSGAGATIIDGGGQTSVLGVSSGVTAELLDLSIRNGSGWGGAGGLITFANAQVTLRRVAVTGNSGSTGGIEAGGTVTIVDSLIADNYGDPNGGIQVRGTLTITNSTISGNRGRQVNGIFVHFGNARVINTTVALNGQNGGVFGGVSARNSIFASNGGPDCILSEGHNIVADPCTPLTGPNDIGGVDPQLTGLQENGGPTLTHGLYPNSPAIDAGDPGACPPADQRGIGRPQGAACDIGAYEYVPPAPRPATEPPLAATPPPPPPPTASPSASATLRIAGTPSPSPTLNLGPTATATQRRVRKPMFTPTLIDAPPVEEEDAGTSVSFVASSMMAVGLLGLLGTAAAGGYYWRRRRRGRRAG
jgi:CSLREA domain-containing protein